MTAQEAYKHLGTPLNLQEHMLMVAGLVLELKEYWQGPEVDWDMLLQAALLHDVGNVIKFDLEKFPHLLGPELDRIDFWRQEQKRLVARYSTDDHEATEKMLAELGVDDRVRVTIQDKTFGNAKKLAASDAWPTKILLYCDLRVLPDRIGTLKERLDDVRNRLKKYAVRDDFDQLVAACYKIESDIQGNVSKELDVIIDQEKAASHKVGLLNFSVA